MVEIGPNLKEVLINFMNNNVAADHYPGYELKECFGELIGKLAKEMWDEYSCSKIYNNVVHDCPHADKFPTKSGYYWFKNSWGRTVIVYYCKEYDYFTFLGDNTQYKLKLMKLMHGHFIEPMKPIPLP